ncbi:tetratricopeptide repeat protein [Roseateles violae]|uniref:Tetratricopeptide repeat protein n=1 Tax=Roseateles violae TaxID=3058042 RepID=A0ABT8DL59_9BURK|nr:tetratricopeptide repeat protein [Pelomonas sp. PFR6]MDN3919149.1 tetratricopeptide repeat protein [Pelomonas sp. PFR6]
MASEIDAGGAAARPGLKLWLGVGAFVALFAAGGYAWLGNPAGLEVPPPEPQQAALDEMVDRLAQRLARQPDDAQGWAMLGRSYAVLGRFPEAVQAYRQLIALRPRDAQALADYADMLASAHGGELQGEPLRLVEQALSLDPDNQKALALAGSAALRRGEPALARRHWQRALALSEPGSELAREFEAMIADTEAATQAQVASTRQEPAAASGAVIEGRVTLAPALAAQVAPGDTLFIFARAVQGPPMPLAILRKTARELPLDFRLDDSLAMSPAAKLSGAGQVIVGARISKSGQALPQPGDLQALSAPVAVGTRGLQLQIAETLR